MANSSNIFTFRDERPQLCPVLEYTTDLQKSQVPLVIDNGTYQCRAGWATSEKPQLMFKNITARPKNKKVCQETDIQVGNEINTTEMAKWLLKSQFDRNVVTQYDVQELIFDYIFSHMGINTDGYVNHPIVLTEAVCNPNYCRQQMSELLFECYNVPQVTYGVDAMFSLYANQDTIDNVNSLIVSCGYQTTHLLPVLGGHLDPSQCRRINLGGYHLEAFMQRLLQLKYPGHFASVSLTRAEELVRDHCHLATDYHSDLHEWVADDYYDDHVHKIQLPYNNAPGNQISAEQLKEKREQQIKRLKEVTSKRRMEKLAAEEQKLQELMSIQELLEDEDDEAFDRALQNTSFDNPEELQEEINRLTVGIQRNRAKVLGIEPPPEEDTKKKVYDLLDIPDDQLTADQLQAKKKQRMLKNAREGRARTQALQREQRQKELEEERKLEEKRKRDFSGWLKEVRGRRQKLLDARTARKQRKTDMAKRRTLASQQRMKMITQLAASESGSSKKKVDTFGQNDADWDVYKEIHPTNADSDSDAEEDQIEELEAMLREHDPEYQKELDIGGEEFDIAEYYRLHLAIERIRVPELLFQPSMLGIEQAGISETMDFLLRKYDDNRQKLLVQNVFLTGGNAQFLNFKERLEKELLEMRPFQSMFSVTRAADPVLDAWRGARKFAISPNRSMFSVTKAEYTEKGGEYLKEHSLSNKYFSSPVLIKQEK